MDLCLCYTFSSFGTVTKHGNYINGLSVKLWQSTSTFYNLNLLKHEIVHDQPWLYNYSHTKWLLRIWLVCQITHCQRFR